MTDPNVLTAVWPVLLSLIFVIVWCIRLESKVLYLEKDLENHKLAATDANKVIWSKWDTLQATLNQVLQAVGELKGRLEQ